MKLMIRNTSRDKTTAAMRKARPGDVQPNPTIKKVRLPPGGSLTVDSNDLSSLDARLIQKLMGCGCLRTFAMTSSGPMRAIGADEIGELCDLSIPVLPPAPAPAPVTPEPEPVAVTEEVAETAEQEQEKEAPAEEPAVEEEPEEKALAEEAGSSRRAFSYYLRDELQAMKNAQLRSILSDWDYGRTTGMNKSALINAVLETQES